jgi:hypothetical protein
MEEPASCRPPDGLETLVDVLAVHRLTRLAHDDDDGARSTSPSLSGRRTPSPPDSGERVVTFR